MAKNLIRNNSIVYGGGAAEIACSIAVEAAVDRYLEVEQYAIKEFADALDSIPMALVEDIWEDNPHFGIYCNDVDTNVMREQN
ncbi:T-complex protein 1 subunit epsilon, partial [Asimina triloba]